ncbi:hypothetical protein BJX70DRAFT_356342 [Aspergillus crustosus]
MEYMDTYPCKVRTDCLSLVFFLVSEIWFPVNFVVYGAAALQQCESGFQYMSGKAVGKEGPIISYVQGIKILKAILLIPENLHGVKHS